ncbi:MAG: PmoA family protein [Pirellulales bacterium]
MQIVTTNVWKVPDGKPVCDDVRTLTFGADETVRWIDFDIAIKASHGPVTFGDTKEGSFGVRVAESTKVEAKKGGKIVDNEGRVDGETWGKRAAWVDYHGPVGKDDVRQGIAILNHPVSFRHPTYWHVRTYGLFAANPFGVHDFEKKTDKVGEYTLPAGETLRFRYRVILHAGDEKQGKIAERYAEYEKSK